MTEPTKQSFEWASAGRRPLFRPQTKVIEVSPESVTQRCSLQRSDKFCKNHRKTPTKQPKTFLRIWSRLLEKSL